jgi:hypothetical protein
MTREITDGDRPLGRGPKVRLIRSIVIFALIAVYFNFKWGDELDLTKRVLLGAAIIGVSLPVWGYLEFRNLVIARSQKSRSMAWKAAALGVHPVMIPIYLIVLPIVIYLSMLTVRHSRAKEAGKDNPAASVMPEDFPKVREATK